SIAGHLAGYSTSMVYSAAKASVLQLTRSAAMELGEYNIRVNSISPGAIATGIFGKALGLTGQAAEDSASVAGEVLSKAQPIRRAGQPEDIAKAAVFLASDDSTFVNAADLLVDGGMIGGRHWSAHQESVKQLGKAFTGG
ncbi:MAG: SDR family oxidoreductase, partial [Sneathiella sp.]